MTISNLSLYNSIKSNTLRSQSASDRTDSVHERINQARKLEAQARQAIAAAGTEQASGEATEQVKEVKPVEMEIKQAPAHSDAREFQHDFKQPVNFNLVGATSSIEDVDLEKAKKEMAKENVLNQYRFFVDDPKKPNLGTDMDGTVKLKN